MRSTFIIILSIATWLPYQAFSAKAKLGDQETFKVALSYFPKNLNVLTGLGLNSFRSVIFFDSMVEIDATTLEYVPYLAKSFHFDPKNNVVEFQLRKGVKFHDGHELDSGDIAFSFDLLTQTPVRAGLNPEAKRVLKHEVVDKHRIKFYLNEPSFTAKELLYFMNIFPEHIYKEIKTEKQANKIKNIVGTGAYQLKKYIPNKSILVEKNKNWWGRPHYKNRYHFEKILFKNVSDVNTQLQLFNRKELDYVQLSPDLFSKKDSLHIDQDHGRFLYSKLKYAGTGLTLWLNSDRPEFATIKSRKAFIHLINRQFINEKFFDNKAVISAGPWSVDRPYSDKTIQPLEFNPDLAIKLLKEEGWQLDQSKKLFYKNIKGPNGNFKHYYQVTVQLPSQNFEKHFGIIQSDLKKYGIDLSIKFIDWNSLLKLYEQQKYDMGLTSRASGVNTYFPMFNYHSKQNDLKAGDWNLANFANPEADQLIEKLEATWKISERNKILKKIYKLIAEEYPAVYLFDYTSAHFLVRKDLKTPQAENPFIPTYHFWHY